MKLICIVFLGLFASLDALHFEKGRIIGGFIVQKYIPYQVSLLSSNGSHFCAGAIITHRWIITAAHCIYGLNANIVKPHQIRVGIIRLRDKGRSYNITKFIPHEGYNPNYSMNDIGLVKVNKPIVFEAGKIQNIIISNTTVPDGSEVMMTGWGRTYMESPIPNTMRAIYMKKINDLQCATALQDVGTMYNFHLCTFFANGRGICDGDSGNPVVFKKNGIAELVGITSWSFPCARGSPDVHSKVSYYSSWIMKTILEN